MSDVPRITEQGIVTLSDEEWELGRSFVRESTLTSNFDFQTMNAAKDRGFEVSVMFVCLESAERSVERVKERHAQGGHTVPEDDIKRRYARSLKNLPQAIKAADKVMIFDNTDKNFMPVAEFEKGKLVKHHNTPEWFKAPLEALKTQEMQQQKTPVTAAKKHSGPER
jgi:predicted ABC-type ATPase